MRTRLLFTLGLLAVSPALAQTSAVHAKPQPCHCPSSSSARAASVDLPAPSPTVIDTVVPGQYEGGPIRRTLLGKQYRQIWNTRIAVPELDLGRFAGGLKPLKEAGGLETIGLHMKGADGLVYKFRSVEKHPTKSLPKPLQKGPLAWFIRDQMSQEYPGANLIAAGLLDAAGVLHATPRIYVMPDDPRLREFRAKFGGMLGTIEQQEPPFPGARYFAKTEDMFDSLKADPTERVDARAYLKARLMDVFMGDWDRHIGQWEWAAFKSRGGIIWEPVPEDRDWAFGRWDGVAGFLIRQVLPQTAGFRPEYPPMLNLTWTGKEMDHRLLQSLDRPVWDSMARDLTSRLSDSAIASAIGHEPPEFGPVAGEELGRALRTRRDHLIAAATEMYQLVSVDADVHGTDASERVLIERAPGTVDVAINAQIQGKSVETFHRRFLEGETHEIRVYLHGGADTVVVRGPRSRIMVRVVGHPYDRLIDSSAGPTRFYDDERDYPVPTTARKRDREQTEADQLKATGSTQTVSEQFAPLAQGQNFMAPAEPLTWGHRWVSLPFAAYHSGQGAMLGMSAARYGYGFRAEPYRSQIKLKVGYALGAPGLRLDVLAEDRHLLPDFGGRVESRFSQVETFRFYGFGNASPPVDESTTLSFQDLVRIWPQLFFESPRINVTAGPLLQLTRPHLVAGTPLASLAPLGSNQLVIAGGRGKAGWNGGAVFGEGLGARVTLESTLGRSVSGAYASFMRAGAHAATYFTPAGISAKPTLAVRAGYQRVWGTYPFQEAAQLGGEQDLRGYDVGRFAGDAAAYAGSELRIRALAAKGLDLGVMGLADVGRVFLKGEDASGVHTSLGGGLWATAPGIGTVNFVAAWSADETEIFIYTGLGFVHF